MSDRLRIDAVTPPGHAGRVGMCACPGVGRALGGGRGSVAEDVAAMRAWGAQGVVSLVEVEELWALEAQELPNVVRQAGLWWSHLPIMDMCAPDEYFEMKWAEEGPRLRDVLRRGGSFVVHCWAGLGRTGTIAARLLVELGADAETAVRQVRDARPGTIQTLQQELHVRRCAPVPE